MSSGQIHTLDYVIQRAAQAPRLTSVVIYQGFIDEVKTTRPKLQVLTPSKLTDGNQFGAQWDFFRANSFGNFSAVFNPNRELIYFENRRAGEAPELVVNGNTGTLDLAQLIDRLTERELSILNLQQQVSELQAELDEEKSMQGKFAFGLEKVLTHFFPQVSAVTTVQAPLQGTGAQPNTHWTNVTIQEAEDALFVIVEAMGTDWLTKFAKKLQAQPELVNTIKSYL